MYSSLNWAIFFEKVQGQIQVPALGLMQNFEDWTGLAQELAKYQVSCMLLIVAYHQ